MRLHSNRRLPKSNRLLALSLLLMTLMAGACSTPRSSDALITPTERIQRDLVVGAGLARQFETQLHFKKDKSLLIYLHELTAKLTASVPELKTSAVSVQISSDRGARWNNYALPGNRLYLSVGLLKAVQYENQLAAAIAIELSHISKRHVPMRLQEVQGSAQGNVHPADFASIEGLVPSANGSGRAVDFFSPTGIFAFPDEYFIESVDQAVGILYQAGFDPRGLVSLLGLYRSHARQSPLEDNILKKLIEKTRTIIAEYSPLRNPIVRSPAFIVVQKRTKKL